MKFLKLTERHHDKTIPIVVNAEYISVLKLGNGGSDTMVQLRNAPGEKNTYYFVAETVEEIWEMLRDG